MLRLHRALLALVLWLTFLFNIERLNWGGAAVLSITLPVYFVAAGLVALGLLLPQVARIRAWPLYLVAVAGFLVVKRLDPRPDWGEGYAYLSLFELIALLVTAWLSYTVGRLSVEFLETIQALLFEDLNDRVFSAEGASPLVKREMQKARRSGRALSVVVLQAPPEEEKIILSDTAREIQHILVQRAGLVSLTRLLVGTVRRTDFVIDQSTEDRMVLVAPELAPDQASALIERLNKLAYRRLGFRLKIAAASFPDEGLTFEELMYQAERELDAIEIDSARRGSESREQSRQETRAVEANL